ncbi:MAG: hypothetical protein ACM3JB_20615 [Acidobacteriaceae bacterium]
MTQRPKSGTKKSSAKKDHPVPVHPTAGSHHSSAHHSDRHDHSHDHPERRARPRGDDIFTKIQDATEKVLRDGKHQLKK